MISIWKPWFVKQPRQLFVRMIRQIRPAGAERIKVKLACGVELFVDPKEAVGRSIWTTGVFDIAVSELIFRMLPIGGKAIDAGANIGYMSLLMAKRAGAAGEVHSFEPHPRIIELFKQNIALSSPGSAKVQLHEVGLSDRAGTAYLEMPEDFEANQGIGFINTGAVTGANPAAGFSISTARLDDLFPTHKFDLMKMDIEGHEAHALRGAEKLLVEKRIVHVVFEEHEGPASETCKLFLTAGYSLYQLGWHMNGLRLAGLDQPAICSPYEAPSYVATHDPASLETKCAQRGWKIFGA